MPQTSDPGPMWLAIFSVAILGTCVAVGMGVAPGLTVHRSKAVVVQDVIADVLPAPVMAS